MSDIIASPSGQAPLPSGEAPKRQGNYVNANYKLIDLDDEQKAFVAAHWADPAYDIKRLTQETFKNNLLNGHHREGKSIKAYIATLGTNPVEPPKPKTTASPKKGKVELTEEQKTAITALLNQEEPPTVREIFRMIYPEIENYSTLSGEYQAISRFVKATNEDAMDIWDDPVTDRRYRAPSSVQIVIGIVNDYVSNPVHPTRKMYDMAKMKSIDEKNMRALLGFMKTLKFVLGASQYEKRADRDLFESTFVRHTHDKASDLISEEVDTYIALAAETVKEARIERQILKEETLMNECLDGEDDQGNKPKLSLSIVESLKSLRTERKETKTHTHRLITSVSGSRDKRVANRATKNDHVGNWLSQWIEEQTRKDLIALGEAEHAEDAAEFGRIKSVDDSWALIAGMTEDEANGAP